MTIHVYADAPASRPNGPTAPLGMSPFPNSGPETESDACFTDPQIAVLCDNEATGASRRREPEQRTNKIGLIESVEMMHWSMALADSETIRRLDRGADPGLGRSHRGFHVLAFGKARRDRRR